MSRRVVKRLGVLLAGSALFAGVVPSVTPAGALLAAEDGRPIWHYNQTPQEYDGRFDQPLTHTGPTGSYTTEHTWPAGSAYPDSFIIGDPHLNYYEGSAVVDDIRLYTPKN